MWEKKTGGGGELKLSEPEWKTTTTTTGKQTNKHKTEKDRVSGRRRSNAKFHSDRIERQLVGAVSPVSHRGSHQGYRKTNPLIVLGSQ